MENDWLRDAPRGRVSFPCVPEKHHQQPFSLFLSFSPVVVIGDALSSCSKNTEYVVVGQAHSLNERVSESCGRASEGGCSVLYSCSISLSLFLSGGCLSKTAERPHNFCWDVLIDVM